MTQRHEKTFSGNGPFHAVPVTDRIYWVGAVDWNLRYFHGYATERGTTYNAYLILADKVTLVDTVREPFVGELLERIASVIDPASIDYIVSNHAEMDHSGGLPEVISAVKPEKVFASVNGVKALTDHFHLGQEITPVKDGESLSLGNATLSFMETRMLHWPDSMFSYLVEDRVLFSNDAFGMHLASAERFDDEIDDYLLDHEAAKYYANILLPYSSLVTKLLDKVAASGLALDIIAPDHGPIWRCKPEHILNAYGVWAAQCPTNKALIVYDTMWHSTEKMAHAIAEGITDGGATVKILPLDAFQRSNVAAEMLDAGALVIGSPTMNNNMFPTVADVLTYLKGLRPQNIVGAAFGSYGWGGEAAKQIHDTMTAMGIDMVADPLRVKYVPDHAALTQCYDLGKSIAEALSAKIHQA